MEENHEHHIMPFKVYLNVFLSLAILTILTVLAPMANLGVFSSFVALLIATIKALLVMAYFMHLKYDTGMNRLIFGASFFFVFLLLIFCVADIWSRVFVQSTL